MAKFLATGLFLALQNDDEDEVINQLNAGADAKMKDADGRTFLHHAVEMKCKIGIIRELMKRADIAERDEEGDTVLDKILEKEDKDLDDLFIEFIDNTLSEGDADKLEEIVLSGWEIPRPSSSKRKKIRESSEAMDVLLDNIKSFEDRVKDIHRAILEGNTRLLKQLVDKKNVVKARDETGLFPLHKAIIYDQMETVKYLVESFPALVDKKDSHGRTPLHYAAVSTDSRDKYKLLVDAGADEDIEDNKEHTPKYYQEHQEEIDLVAFRQKLDKILSKPRKHLKARPSSKKSGRAGSRPGSDRAGSGASDRQRAEESKRSSLASGSISMPSRVKTDPHFKKDVPPPKTEDGLYCASVLGEALTLALAEIVDKRPWDPIEFLADWLHSYAANKERIRRATALEEEMQRQAELDEEERLWKEKCEKERLQLEAEQQQQRQEEEAERAKQEEEERRQREKSLLSGPPMPTLKEEEAEEDPTTKMERVNIRDENGQTELHRAVLQEGADLDGLVVRGFSIGLRDSNGKTPRDLAEEAERADNVEAIDNYVRGLFEKGQVDDIMMLILTGYTKIPNLAEKYGEDGAGLDQDAFDIWKNLSTTQETLNSNYQAILKGSIRELRGNLSRKVYSQSRDEQGRSLLHLAVLYNRQDIVEYLLQDFPHLINFKDNFGRTPLHYATAVDPKLKEMLVNAGADMIAVDMKQHSLSYFEENKEEILSQRVEVPEEGGQQEEQAEEEQAEGGQQQEQPQLEEGSGEQGQIEEGGQMEEGGQVEEGGQEEEGGQQTVA